MPVIEKVRINSGEIAVGTWICNTTGEEFMKYVLKRRAEGKAEFLGMRGRAYLAWALHESNAYTMALMCPRKRNSILTIQAEGPVTEEDVRYVGEDFLAVTASREIDDPELAAIANSANEFATRMMNGNTENGV